MRRTEPLAVWGLAALLFAATDPLIPLLARGAADMATTAELAAAASARRPVWAAIYLVCALVLWRARAEAAAALAAQPVLPFALAWFAASCLWAPRPLDAGAAFAQFALLLAAGLAAGARAGPLGAVQAVARMALLALAGSAAMAVISPTHAFGQQINVGALRGVYVEKNHLALILSLGFAAALFEAQARPGRARLWLAAGALLAGLVLARSSVALGAAGLAAALATARLALAGARYGGAAAGAAALAGVAALGAAAPLALAALGEDATLNDRTVLWAALLPHLAERPWTGHGFAAFWTTEAAEALRAQMGWHARGAHNGWITAALHGGAVGLGLWLAVWAGAARRGLAALAPSADPARAGAAGLGAVMLVHLLWSGFESTQLGQMNLHGLVAGLCLSLAVRSRAPAASRAARARNSGLPIT